MNPNIDTTTTYYEKYYKKPESFEERKQKLLEKIKIVAEKIKATNNEFDQLCEKFSKITKPEDIGDIEKGIEKLYIETVYVDTILKNGQESGYNSNSEEKRM